VRGDQEHPHRERKPNNREVRWVKYSFWVGECDALIYSGMRAPIPPLKVDLLLCYKTGLASL